MYNIFVYISDLEHLEFIMESVTEESTHNYRIYSRKRYYCVKMTLS